MEVCLNKWDKLSIPYSEFKKKIEDFVNNNKGFSLKVKLEHPQGKTTIHYQLLVKAPNELDCLIECWEKREGLTVKADCGANPALGIKICSAILNSVEQTQNKNQRFPNINTKIYTDLINTLSEKYKVDSIEDRQKGTINTRIQEQSYLVSATYYKNETLFLQGKSTILWKSILLDVYDKIGVCAEEIIEQYFTTQNDLERCKIKCDNGLLVELSIKLIGEEVYNDNRILKDYERKWLHTATFFHYTEIDLEDNCHSVASSVKIIEGLLRRILYNKSIPWNKEILPFEKIEPSNKHELKKDYCIYIDTEAKKHIEDLYEFINKIRNDLFHDEGEGEDILTKEKSIAIFNDILVLLKKSYKIADKLFN